MNLCRLPGLLIELAGVHASAGSNHRFPVPVENRLLIRGAKTLFCIDAN